MIKKSTTVRTLVMMLQAVCLFLVFSSVSNAADKYTPNFFTGPSKCLADGNTFPGRVACDDYCNTKYGLLKPKQYEACKNECKSTCPLPKLNQTQAVTVVQYALIPIQFLITYVAYIMGFFFVAWGLYRLRHGHEGSGYNRQHSGTGTVLCFIAAAMLFQYQWTTHMLGNSIMGTTDKPGGWVISNTGSLPVDPKNLFGYVQGSTAQLRKNEAKTSGNGILQGNIWNQYGQAQESFMTLETLFAVLMVVGYISFLRGAMLLVKMGEGTGGGESSGTKAVVHIVAAALLCNANHVTALINNLTNQIGPVSGPT
jgi:hypothetical protein